jgi:hypothetical protein
MRSEKTLLMTHNQGDDGTCERAVDIVSVYDSMRSSKTNVPTGGLSRLSCIFFFACSRYAVLIGLVLVTRPSLVLKDRLNIVRGR